MSINWIPKIQGEQDTLYPDCDKKSPYTWIKRAPDTEYPKSPGRAWKIPTNLEMVKVAHLGCIQSMQKKNK